MGRRSGSGRLPWRSSAALAGVAALLLGACSAGGDDDGGGSGASGGGRGTLRYGYDLAAQFTNTFDISTSNGDCDAIPLFHIFDTLVHKEPGNELTPGLAESWEVVDPSTLELKLREGVTFHDGTSMDAAAVQQSLERAAKNDQLTDLAKIEDYEVVDDLTLRLTFSDPIAVQMPASFTGRDGMVMAPASTNEKPIGAGPFRFDGYEPGAAIRLTKYEDHWNADAYQFAGIDFVQTATGPPAVTALQAGDVDVIRMEAESVPALEEQGARYEVATQPTGAYLQFEFRQGFPPDDPEPTPFAKTEVRQAIAHAIDRERINEVVQGGRGEVASQPFPEDSPAYVPALADRYPYDPEKAKELLTEAGYPDGFEFTMAIPGGDITNMERQATLLQEMLQAVGLKPKIERILGSDIGTQFYIVGNGDAFAAAELDSTFPTGKLKSAYGNDQFVALWDGAERDDITDLMAQAEGTTDLDETYGLVQEASKISVENALDVPIAFMPQFMGYDTDRVGGTLRAQTNICDPPDLSQVTVTGS